MIARMFDDLDVDNDGRLVILLCVGAIMHVYSFSFIQSFEEYKLSAMKEPLIVDFLEQFLAEHNLSNYPRVPSRPGSVRSFRSGRSLTPMNGYSPKPPGSPSSLTAAAAAASTHKLSVRLSQAELLEYSHQQQQKLSSVPTTPTSSSHSLKSQAMGLPPSPVRSASPVVSVADA